LGRRTPGRLTGLLFAAILWPGALQASSWTLALQQDTTRQQDTARVTAEPQRDAVGDLNAGALAAGEFTGGIVIQGATAAMAIGGFIKTLAIVDSRLEVSGADLKPETIGTIRPDRDGNFAVDATLSRWYFDVRAVTQHGRVRGYLEWDLNNGNNGALALKPRHVYATWHATHGTLLAGHTWTTFMNTTVIPEGVTEATVSGLAFARQAQLRWTQHLGAATDVAAAVESPATGDFLIESGAVARTRWPDIVGALDLHAGTSAGLRLSGLIRWIKVGSADSGSRSTGWGTSLSGYWKIGGRDRVMLGGTYGRGIARYLLGFGTSASGIVDADTLYLLDNYGGFVSYRHDWSGRTRSTAAIGHASVSPLATQPDDAFRRTTYAFVSRMWSPMPFLTGGLEYAYGMLELHDGSTRGNHRLVLGVQIF